MTAQQSVATLPEPDAQLAPLPSWAGAICDSDLAPHARLVALTLALYVPILCDDDPEFPGLDVLASDTGLDSSSVHEGIVSLYRAGWLALDPIESGQIVLAVPA